MEVLLFSLGILTGIVIHMKWVKGSKS